MSTKIKVLFIGPLPPPFSGPELSMHQFLTSELLNESYDIDFLKTNFRNKNKSKGKFGAGMIFNFFIFFARLLKKLLAGRPKLVYYPITPTQVGWIGRDIWTILFSRLFGAKVVIHLRGSHFKLNFNNFNFIVKRLVGFSLKRVSKAIVQANYLKDQFSPFIETSNVEVLYQSMDTREFPYVTREKAIKGKILIVGHLTKSKGYTDIVKIIPKIAEKHPYVKFCFAGEMRKGERGVFYNQFTNEKIIYEDPFEIEKNITNSSFAKNYERLGVIQGKEKVHHFATTSIFISASYSEGFSRSLLEAMSTGIPLIYTPVGAHREVLDESNGICVNPGELNALENAILNLIESNDLNEISLKNRTKVENSFSVEIICQEFNNILLKTILKK